MGALVLNERNEVLMVQEKNGILRGKGIWKIPTGCVSYMGPSHPHALQGISCFLGATLWSTWENAELLLVCRICDCAEDLTTAVEREVLEETGEALQSQSQGLQLVACDELQAKGCTDCRGIACYMNYVTLCDIMHELRLFSLFMLRPNISSLPNMK